MILAPLTHQDAEPLAKQYRPLMALGMVPFLIGALSIHLRPNHSRELKYTLVLIPLGSGLFFAGASTRQMFVLSDSWLELLIIAIILPLLLWWASIFLAEMLLLPRLLHRWDTRSRSFSRLYIQIFSILRMRAFWIVMSIGVMIAPTVAIPLLGARYILIEAFRRHPILYLRSFHQEQAATIFGRAIAPALAPFGVIEALVHRTQTESSLLSRAPIWQFGLLAAVSDTDWQSWVSHGINRCSLVVIDCSVRTESVDWEVQLALRDMSHNRVLIIASGATSSSMAHGIPVSSYSTDRKGVDRLRSEVRSRARKCLDYDPRKAQRIWLMIFVVIIVVCFVALTAFVALQT